MDLQPLGEQNGSGLVDGQGISVDPGGELIWQHEAAGQALRCWGIQGGKQIGRFCLEPEAFFCSQREDRRPCVCDAEKSTDAAALASFSEQDKRFSVSEFRSRPQQWLICKSKTCLAAQPHNPYSCVAQSRWRARFSRTHQWG